MMTYHIENIQRVTLNGQEHEIGYAYPTSTSAEKHRAPGGCWTLKIGGKETAHASYELALQAAAAAGTAPIRWSVDHPKNAHFLAAPWQ